MKPVRPGDTLRVTGEVIEARPSKAEPDRGVVTLRYRTFNQHGEEVMSFLCPHLVKRRPA